MSASISQAASWTVADLLPAFDAQPLAPDRGGYTLTMRECCAAIWSGLAAGCSRTGRNATVMSGRCFAKAGLPSPAPICANGAQLSRFSRVSPRACAKPRSGAARADTLYISNIPWMLAQPSGFFGESHQPYLRDGAATALELVHANLAALAPAFQWVVSAMQLRSDATPDNLQWLTQIKAPMAFLEDANWRGLAIP